MLEIFQYDFMIRAMIAGIIIGIIAPMIGIFLVVRRYSLMADTLAHVSLAGVAFSFLLNTAALPTALAVTILAGVGMEQIRSRGKLFGESVLAIFLTGSLAVSVVLLSIAKGFNTNLFGYLFGSIATVSPHDLVLITILGIIVFLAILLLYKELFFISLTEELARAAGIRTRPLNFFLVILASVTIALSMRIVGILLIGALMVIPVVTAMQFGFGFRKTLIYGIGISLLSVIAGLFVSYYLDLASGGTIVLISLMLFFIGLLISKR